MFIDLFWKSVCKFVTQSSRCLILFPFLFRAKHFVSMKPNLSRKTNLSVRFASFVFVRKYQETKVIFFYWWYFITYIRTPSKADYSLEFAWGITSSALTHVWNLFVDDVPLLDSVTFPLLWYKHCPVDRFLIVVSCENIANQALINVGEFWLNYSTFDKKTLISTTSMQIWILRRII